MLWAENACCDYDKGIWTFTYKSPHNAAEQKEIMGVAYAKSDSWCRQWFKDAQ